VERGGYLVISQQLRTKDAISTVVWIVVCQSMEGDFSDIVCGNPRDFSIGACGEQSIVMDNCFKVSVSWF
jgi:hypothetical protein